MMARASGSGVGEQGGVRLELERMIGEPIGEVRAEEETSAGSAVSRVRMAGGARGERRHGVEVSEEGAPSDGGGMGGM